MEQTFTQAPGNYLPVMSDEEFERRIALLKANVRDRRDRCIALGKAYLGIAFDERGKEVNLKTLSGEPPRSMFGNWTAKFAALTEKS